MPSGKLLEVNLLLIATLVASLTKQLAVLLLGHTLAALLDNRAHTGSSQTNKKMPASLHRGRARCNGSWPDVKRSLIDYPLLGHALTIAWLIGRRSQSPAAG